MTQQKRQRVLLGILGVLLLLWGGRWLLGGSGDGGGGGGIAVGTGAGDLPQVARLHYQALEPEQGKFEPGRDIFRYGQTGPSPEELRARRAAQERPTPPPQPRPAPRTSSEPQPPPVTLAFLGTFGPRDAPIAVFSGDEVIYNARQGDVIEEKFIVRQIGLESVDLGFVGFPEDVTERLGVGS